MNIPSQLIEVIDIALAGYRKKNEDFIISIQHKEAEILQIINRNMVQECKAENSSFGIVLCICFDRDEDHKALYRFTHSHFKFDATVGLDSDKALAYYFLALPENSEKAAKITCKLLEKTFLIKSTQHLNFELYDAEE